MAQADSRPGSSESGAVPPGAAGNATENPEQKRRPTPSALCRAGGFGGREGVWKAPSAGPLGLETPAPPRGFWEVPSAGPSGLETPAPSRGFWEVPSAGPSRLQTPAPSQGFWEVPRAGSSGLWTPTPSRGVLGGPQCWVLGAADSCPAPGLLGGPQCWVLGAADSCPVLGAPGVEEEEPPGLAVETRIRAGVPPPDSPSLQSVIWPKRSSSRSGAACRAVWCWRVPGSAIRPFVPPRRASCRCHLTGPSAGGVSTSSLSSRAPFSDKNSVVPSRLCSGFCR